MAAILYHCWGGARLYLVSNVEPAEPPVRVDAEKQTILRRQQVIAILNAASPPIDRCLAAAAVPRLDLFQIVSEKHAINLQSAGQRIDFALHERLRSMRAPFRCLFALYGFPVADQAQELDAWTERCMTALGGERVKPVRAMNRARDARRAAALVDRVGERRAKFLINQAVGKRSAG